VLVFMILLGLFAPFLSPNDPTIAGRNPDYQNGAPQIPSFCDHNGCSARPFLYAVERHRGIETNFRWVTKVNKEKRRYVYFFVEGAEYSLFGLKFKTHLFGAEGGIHLFGTDAGGKDIFSRTLHAINTSLAEKSRIIDGVLGERAQALDASLGEKAEAFDASLKSGIQSLDASLGQKAEAIQTSLAETRRALDQEDPPPRLVRTRAG